ncbi:hypothetical protein EDB44_11259 [Vibrio crassostreae]|uniref:hypothetical protein n=1 Tax=Vibrio crassostreae TaxID=246167 RepID=UPI00105232F6|nr:hypothetical protein [Vibrio crassostreae]TCT60438.1 hypothetical protein EDB44_11259 [Vibrio crassostreae]TCT82170.1 hypothetical protein EDB43_11259 [Vibrio crassostreae]
MKKRLYPIITTIMVATLALPASSKVTLDDVYAADAPKRARDLANNAAHMARHSSPLYPQKSDSSSGKVVNFSVGGEANTVRTIALKSTTGWACALSKVSGFYGRGLKGNYARVYQDGSVWKLKSGRASCGGCSVSAEAICWETK